MKRSGPAAAIVLAACLGAFVLGLTAVLAHASKGIKGFLNWYSATGSLSGKVGVAIIVWLVAWGVLHAMWRDRDVAFRRVFVVSLLLLALGFLGVFPPFFELF